MFDSEGNQIACRRHWRRCSVFIVNFEQVFVCLESMENILIDFTYNSFFFSVLLWIEYI